VLSGTLSRTCGRTPPESGTNIGGKPEDTRLPSPTMNANQRGGVRQIEADRSDAFGREQRGVEITEPVGAFHYYRQLLLE
jgi:hypothetical protein